MRASRLPTTLGSSSTPSGQAQRGHIDPPKTHACACPEGAGAPPQAVGTARQHRERFYGDCSSAARRFRGVLGWSLCVALRTHTATPAHVGLHCLDALSRGEAHSAARLVRVHRRRLLSSPMLVVMAGADATQVPRSRRRHGGFAWLTLVELVPPLRRSRKASELHRAAPAAPIASSPRSGSDFHPRMRERGQGERENFFSLLVAVDQPAAWPGPSWASAQNFSASQVRR